MHKIEIGVEAMFCAGIDTNLWLHFVASAILSCIACSHHRYLAALQFHIIAFA